MKLTEKKSGGSRDSLTRSGTATSTSSSSSGSSLMRGFSAVLTRKDTYERAKEIGKGNGPMAKCYRYRDLLAREYNAEIAKAKKARGSLIGSGGCDSAPCVVVEDKKGNRLRFVPIVSDGSCGFAAIAKGVNLCGMDAASGEVSDDCDSFVTDKSSGGSSGGSSPVKITAMRVRKSIRDEVQEHKEFYDSEAKTNDGFRYLRKRCSDDTFCSSVVNAGACGHWLGSKWGHMEIVAAARAFRITIELYTFDEDSQELRMYEDVKHGPLKIGLLYSGLCDTGHYDLLVPTSR